MSDAQPGPYYSSGGSDSGGNRPVVPVGATVSYDESDGCAAAASSSAAAAAASSSWCTSFSVESADAPAPPATTTPLPTIEAWLAELGLEKYAAKFAEEDISWDTLRDMGEADFKDLGLTLGHRKKAMADLKLRLAAASPVRYSVVPGKATTAAASPAPAKVPTASA
jgi:hypothetical protein